MLNIFEHDRSDLKDLDSFSALTEVRITYFFFSQFQNRKRGFYSTTKASKSQDQRSNTAVSFFTIQFPHISANKWTAPSRRLNPGSGFLFLLLIVTHINTSPLLPEEVEVFVFFQPHHSCWCRDRELRWFIKKQQFDSRWERGLGQQGTDGGGRWRTGLNAGPVFCFFPLVVTAILAHCHQLTLIISGRIYISRRHQVYMVYICKYIY